MGLSSITNRVAYQGNGSSTVFAFPYYFFSQSDLAVYLFDINSSVIYPQVLNTNYTVGGSVNSQGVYPSGGNVIMNSSFPSNLDIIITRSPALVQNFVLNQNGPINSLALVQQFDYLTTLVQRLQDEVSRSVILPDGMGPINGSTFSTVLPSNISQPGVSGNQVLAINSGATGFTLVTVTPSGSSGILPVSGGGTGQGSNLTPGSVVYAATAQAMGITTVGTVGQVLTSQGAGAPTWSNAATGSSSSFTGSISLTNQVSGILPIPNGGTGLSSILPQFGIVYTASPTLMGVVPNGAVGQVLQAQGSSAPIWTTISGTGSTSLINGVVGVLPVANGGSNLSTLPTLGSVIWASSATSMGVVPPGTPGQFLQFNGSSAPSWATPPTGSSGGGITGSVSLTTQVSGILPVANGGIGVNAIIPQFGLLYASSATQVAIVPSSTSGLILQSQGSSAPKFASLNLGGGNAALIGALPITNGGTGQITASSAFNTLAPSQTGFSGFVLSTDGNNPFWTADPGSSIRAKYSANTNGTVNSSQVLNFANQVYDTNSAVTAGSSWIFTAPSAGAYHVEVFFNDSTTPLASLVFYLKKNGIPLESFGYANLTIATGVATTTVPLALNDTIGVFASTPYLYQGGTYGAATTGVAPCVITITRTGS